MQAIRFEKTPGDNRVWGVTFEEFPELRGGDTISSATATTDAGINIFTATVSGAIVLFQMSGGTQGTVYRVIVTATLASGTSLVQYVDMHVIVPTTV